MAGRNRSPEGQRSRPPVWENERPVGNRVLMRVDKDPRRAADLVFTGKSARRIFRPEAVIAHLAMHRITAYARKHLSAHFDPGPVARALIDAVRFDIRPKLAPWRLQQQRRIRAICQ